MADKNGRITVWCQHFADRPYLMLQWLDPVTGKRKSKSAGTCNPLDAEKKRADLEYELNHGLYREPAKLPWSAFRELFEAEYLPGVRPGTRKGYRVTLDLFEQIVNPARVASIDERTLTAFVSGLRRRKGLTPAGYQSNTIQTKLRFLHGALSWAKGQHFIDHLPRFPFVKVPKKRPQPVPAEAFERLQARAADPQLRCVLLCGWLAGLRLAEACLLEWEPTTEAPYIDLGRNRIIFPAEFVKAVEDQWIPLDEDLREALLALPRHGKKVFRFLSRSGRPILPDSVGHRVVALAKRAGVRLSMRILRRGFGCHYAGTVPAQVLQRLMRHSNISITMDYYANIDQALEAAVRKGKRNVSRNSAPEAEDQSSGAVGATPSQNGT
jgi:integrase